MNRPALWRALGGAAIVALFFGGLARPGSVLAVRDLPLFHLPLRTAFAQLASAGIPAWNPLLNGGQPILSNPNYAAFYPPTWIALLVAPHVAVQLLLLFHAGLAVSGAWRLARHLGCGTPAAAWTALAFAGGGAFVSLVTGLTAFCGLAWLPWILVWGDRLLSGEPDEALGAGSGPLRTASRTLLRAAVPGLGLALQLFAGEPMIVVISALALLCLALNRPGEAPRLSRLPRLTRLAAVGVLAALLAAIQLLPTANRVANSPRGEGLRAAEAASWSMPPQRLLEWVAPGFYGDPMRADEDLYLGWKLHDGNFPYLISVYPGLLIVLLAAAAALTWKIPRRWAWLAMTLLGVFLALGRHNPVYALALEAVPLLQSMRFPEKFLLLATSAMAFASGLAWNHLLESRRSGRRKEVDLALALALVLTGIAAIFAILLAVRPGLAEWWVRQNTLLIAPDRLAAAAAFVVSRTWVVLGFAALAAGVLWLHRNGRMPGRWLVALTLAALTADLAFHARGLHPTVPATQLAEEEVLSGARPGSRIFTDVGIVGRPPVVRRTDRPGSDSLWASVDRLDPYVANLFGLAYVLNSDYDRMLTDWGRFGLDVFRAEADRPLARSRLLDAWAVDQVLTVVPAERMLREKLESGWPYPVDREANPDALGRFRFARRVQLHPDRERALKGSRGIKYWLAEMEHLVDPTIAETARPKVSHARGEVLELEDAGRVIRLHYRAARDGHLIAAMTYDPGWRASIAGKEQPVTPTGIGQLAVRVPEGEHWLELRYWDRAASAGATVTLATLALLALCAWYDRRGGSAPRVP